MRIFYREDYNYGRGLPMKQVHGFVLDKPRRIRDGLIERLGDGAIAPSSPTPATEDDLRAVHEDALIDALGRSRSVARAVELAPLGMLPAFLVRRAVVAPQLAACGGTREALLAAAEAGDWALNLSGGYHHARPGLSHGFCLVNDVAFAVHHLRLRGHRHRILVLDLDLHQGDGNAVAFAGDETVFTASLHEEAAFPHPKPPSDLDVGLPTGLGDEAYLEALDEALGAITARFEPEIVVYVAGSDPHVDDPIGGLSLSLDGLEERDRRVGRFAAGTGAALVALPAGGYTDQSPAINAAGFAALMEVEARFLS